MKKKFISLLLLCTSILSLYTVIPVYASDYSSASVYYDESTIMKGYRYLENSLKENEPEWVAYDCIPYTDELESLVYKNDNVYNYASETDDKFKCIECKKIYETLSDAYVIYAKKYYNSDLVAKIEAGQKELETKLKQTQDKITKAYWENGGGSGAALDIPREQCRVYQTRCHDLIKIYNQERNKPDESEITVAHKVMYNDKTKTGFKYVDNNECIYFENGRMLINEWKEFDDGYRYFNENGLMCHDSYAGLTVDSQGVAVRSEGESNLLPDMNQNKDIKFITHTCRVFGVEYKISNDTTYDKKNDGKIEECIRCNQDGNIYGTYLDEDEELILNIIIYKYKDRLELIE